MPSPNHIIMYLLSEITTSRYDDIMAVACNQEHLDHMMEDQSSYSIQEDNYFEDQDKALALYEMHKEDWLAEQDEQYLPF